MKKEFRILSMHLMIFLCFLAFFPSSGQAEDVWLTVGDGQGLPWPFPSHLDRQVVVSLNNSVEVTSMEMNICDDVEDYLQTGDCTFTTRQVGTDCTCDASEAYGCASVSFVGTDCSIAPGDGPIFNLTYDVIWGAPLQECRDLVPQDVVVKDEYGATIPSGEVGLTSGEFCFVCVANEDCTNPSFCWDGFCNLDSQDPDYGKCYSVAHCQDDGLHCNGEETCDSQAEECQHQYTYPDTICGGPNPAFPLTCSEGGTSSYSCSCDDALQCDDGLNCTGVETCDTGSGGICQPGVPFCEEPTPVCDEGPPTQCFEKDVTITVGDFSAYPGSQDNEVVISLANPDDNILNLSMDIYDEGDYLSCTGCDTLYCPAYCDCEAAEAGDGSCHVVLSYLFCGVGGCSYYPIPPGGDGPVLTVYYDVSEETPPGCIDLAPEVNQVLTWLGGDLTEDLWALPVAGEFCDQCRGNFDCDEDVDGDDLTTFLVDSGRSSWVDPCTNEDPCNGDFDCDEDVDGDDLTTFLMDSGRSSWVDPCAPCDPEEPYCAY